ncbi:hypothetical protein Aph02nite_00600 [Actinoplanes philippinensis]|uniref:Uncharacterized protein n=1 Tax=Actinoplanes philippinensis TaxID=35752 RepID=A0A1I2HMV5_9ACTN|nr:hypothetical protein [Actinoplanes philippinensis]GIE74110.1 hypothetical protein Aph02nite_00600 [Actinoplanes philippinensis]SFF30630.1 hypothetical protein SAMN05421541_108319 [Actinoplanes philippinensis]
MFRDLRTRPPALTVVFALSVAHVVTTLAAASGVTRTGPSDFHVELADPNLWPAGFLLAVPVAVACWHSPAITSRIILSAAVPQFVLAALVALRDIAGGWNDPLIVFGFLYPILMTPVFAAFGGLGCLLARGRRRPDDHPAPSRP